MAIGGLVCFGLFLILAIGAVIMVVSSLFRAFHRGPAGYGPGGDGPCPPATAVMAAATAAAGAASFRACWGACSARRRQLGL